MAVKVLLLVFVSALLSLGSALSPRATSRQSAPESRDHGKILQIDPVADKKYIISLHDGVAYVRCCCFVMRFIIRQRIVELS
jgi:hypothetical protein